MFVPATQFLHAIGRKGKDNEMKVNREALIRSLTAIAPGLGAREVVEQATCYVFQGGQIFTFNDEVSCTIESPIKVEGAVAAKPLLAILGKLPEDEIDVSTKDGGLLIKGSSRRAKITMEADVALPIDSIELPGEEDWQSIVEDLPEAISTAAQCASGDAGGSFALSCVHLTPNYVEGCDNFQAVRYPIATGLASEFLIRRDNAKQVAGLGVSQMAVSAAWVHFRCANGMAMHCRVHTEEYADLGEFFKVVGSPATLPAGLVEAIDKASVFSCDNVVEDQIRVTMAENKLTLRGEGAQGWFMEKKQVVYDGPPISFMIAPQLLATLIGRTTECIIAPGRLRMDVGKFAYVACLAAVDDE